MYERKCDIQNELDTNLFLFGARQTGKSTLLRKKFPNAVYIDLLDTEIHNLYSRRPVLLYQQLKEKQADTLVIVD